MNANLFLRDFYNKDLAKSIMEDENGLIHYSVPDVEIIMQTYASQFDNSELIKELWSLWENLAESGEISIGPSFSDKYEGLKSKIESLKHKAE